MARVVGMFAEVVGIVALAACSDAGAGQGVGDAGGADEIHDATDSGAGADSAATEPSAEVAHETGGPDDVALDGTAPGEATVETTPSDPCNGRCATDELCSALGDCFCTPGLERACTSKGECEAGRRTCHDGAWSECTPIPVDAPEVCDARDNDCDGATDEDDVCRPPCVAPPMPEIGVCGTSWDRRPIVQFAPLPEGLVYMIDVDGAPLATVTLVDQNYFRPPEAIGAGGPPPVGVSATLGLSACRADDAACCSERVSAPVALIESCDVPVAPSPDNLVLSEYLINGDGTPGCPGVTCEAGEAIELTNLSHCPVALDGHHLRYCNNLECTSARRFDNFDAADVIPPRGVFVRIRNPDASTCELDFLPSADSDEIFGIRRSSLELEVDGNINNSSGWFNNGASGSLRVATGAYSDPFGGTTILLVTGYVANQSDCESVGFDALGACGEIGAGAVPSDELRDNQLGRLWHPCDSVVDAYPPGCFR